MNDDFHLLMIGAMYENGGNTTHRFLDGHPQMFVYPFESQLGTRLVVDQLSSTFPRKYRWPVFDLEASPAEDYHEIIDEECKVRARTPRVSKFRDVSFDFSDDERCKFYCDWIAETGRSRANNVQAFFAATFEAWKNHKKSGVEIFYVGYSPILVVDAQKILEELAGAHFLHVVRNPWSAYADTKQRPVPLSLENYMLGWTLNQHLALLFKSKFPSRVHLIRLEDVLRDSVKTLGAVCDALGLDRDASLRDPSWNGEVMKEVFPWGTIRRATPEANLGTAMTLSAKEKDEIRIRAQPYLDTLDYDSFLNG